MNSAAPKPVAVITGGARGIGLGIARELAADGNRLVLTGTREESSIREVLDGLRDSGFEVIYVRGDVSSAADRQSLVNQTLEQFGRVDVLVNNAGITSIGRKDVLDADEEGFDRVFDINLKGPFFLTQLIAREMIRLRDSGELESASIINISSVSAWAVSTNRGDYCMTKTAIGMATQLWAARLAEFGISVYEIQPGVIRSDMTSGVTEKYDRLIEDGLTLQKRWGEPSDIGRAVRTLVRGDLPYATGQVLNVDGGMHIRTL